MTDRTVLVTGATDGLGRAVAHRRAAAGDRVLVHGRDHAKAEAVADELRGLGAAGTGVVVADFERLDDVRTVGEQVAALTEHLDVLVNNAGVGSGEPDGRDRRVTADGFELRFGVNHLATLLVTDQLLPLLVASAPSRVITVASAGQSPVDLDDLAFEVPPYSSAQAYTRSKLAEIMTVFDFAARAEGSGVMFAAVHPATRMPTKLVIANESDPVETLETGVDTLNWLIAAPALDSGYYDHDRPARAHEQAYDDAVRERLWAESRRLVGLDQHRR